MTVLGGPIPSLLRTFAVAVLCAGALAGCGGSGGGGGTPSSGVTPTTTAPSATAAPLDVSDSAMFLGTLEGKAKGFGSCFVQQTRADSPFTTKVDLSLTGPLVARLLLSPPPAEQEELETVVIVGGTTYSQGGARKDAMWHEGDVGPLKELIGEMDCRTVFDDLAASVKAVKVGPVELFKDWPTQTYTAAYDVAPWTSAHGDPMPSGSTQRSMRLWVRDESLVQIETDLDGATATSYTWIHGTPDATAPPADQIAK